VGAAKRGALTTALLRRDVRPNLEVRTDVQERQGWRDAAEQGRLDAAEHRRGVGLEADGRQGPDRDQRPGESARSQPSPPRLAQVTEFAGVSFRFANRREVMGRPDGIAQAAPLVTNPAQGRQAGLI